MRKTLAVIFYVLVIYGCSSNVGVVYEEGLSRSYIHLNLEVLSGGFESIRDVGGEHIDKYDFLPPKDNVYEISISSLDGNVFAVLEMDNKALWSMSGKIKQKYVITNKNFGRLTLSVMAHPVDKYTLKITKLEKNPL